MIIGCSRLVGGAIEIGAVLTGIPAGVPIQVRRRAFVAAFSMNLLLPFRHANSVGTCGRRIAQGRVATTPDAST